MINENLILALYITLIGMGLVFSALILLWLLMLGLTAFTSDKKSKKVDISKEQELEEKAAAMAVAIAIAEQSQGRVARFPVPPTALVSAWQLSMRTRQMKNGE